MKTISTTALSKFTRRLMAFTGAGTVVLLITAVVSPDRAWANLLVASYYLVTLGLGGAVFLALTTVCGANWNKAFHHIPAAMTGLLPLAGLIMLAALAIRLPMYAWHHHGEGDAGTFWFKEFWLNSSFFAIRAVMYVLLWIGFAKLLVRKVLPRIASGDKSERISARAAILFLVVFAITISLSGIDWIMALEPMWFSTIWGVYQFSGLMMGALAAIILAGVALRRQGALSGIFREEHLHDLGQLLIGFSCFWMYIWFSQYMLIWYSNIPEETSYFILRTQGSWGPLVVGSLVLNWVIPFFVLLPQRSKRSESVMVKVAVVVLIGRWLDLSLMIVPPVTETGPAFGFPEVAALCCLGSLAGILFTRSFFATEPILH